MEGKGGRRGKLLVALLLVFSLVLGIAVVYYEYANTSFPARERPMAEFATVAYQRFNGTEYLFRVQWAAHGNYTTLYAQLTSNEYTTPVFDVRYEGVRPGQVLGMPFPLSVPYLSLHNVNLYLAVRDNSNMSEFTLVYHVESVQAVQGNI
jgi:hypothetical protein